MKIKYCGDSFFMKKSGNKRTVFKKCGKDFICYNCFKNKSRTLNMDKLQKVYDKIPPNSVPSIKLEIKSRTKKERKR